jgi:hypothetical protein
MEPSKSGVSINVKPQMKLKDKLQLFSCVMSGFCSVLVFTIVMLAYFRIETDNFDFSLLQGNWEKNVITQLMPAPKDGKCPDGTDYAIKYPWPGMVATCDCLSLDPNTAKDKGIPLAVTKGKCSDKFI